LNVLPASAKADTGNELTDCEDDDELTDRTNDLPDSNIEDAALTSKNVECVSRVAGSQSAMIEISFSAASPCEYDDEP
jgi:hypothetical protein